MFSPKFQDSKKMTVAAHTIKMCNKSRFGFDFASFLYYFPASGYDNFFYGNMLSLVSRKFHTPLWISGSHDKSLMDS